MELICPSCEARYRVPDGALGENGRQVSCSNCGHGWHAAPPLVLGSAAAPSAGAAMAGSRGHDNDEGNVATAEVHRLRAVEPARAAQLAGIREQIADVQSHDHARAEDERTHVATVADPGRESSYHADTGPVAFAGTGAAGAAARPRAELREAGEAHQDPLRRRMAEHDARAAREREERERLRRSMRDDSRSRGSGAFLTGFLLAVIVAAAALAAYVMHPEIIASAPETEPMLTDFVAWVDGLRLAIDEAWQDVRAWVMDLAER